MPRILIVDGSTDALVAKKVIDVSKTFTVSSHIDLANNYGRAIGLIATTHYDYIVLTSFKSNGRYKLLDFVTMLKSNRLNKKASVVYIDSNPSGRKNVASLLSGREVIVFGAMDTKAVPMIERMFANA